MPTASFDGVLHYLRRHAAPADGVADAELLRRFVEQHDEAAFELIAWRHGRMVLGVCRRVLRNNHDAEDAFQATFLTLAGRAASIARREAIAGWLYHVAYHVALDARRRAAARHEQAEMPPDPLDCHDPAAEAAGHELRDLLDDEVGRLPEKYRLPFVLCCFEGRSNADAARELRCPVGTIESRLTRARERLRAGLTRRGLTLSAVLFTAALGRSIVRAGSPALETLTRSATRLAANAAVRAAIPAPVAALSEGVIRTMFLMHMKAVAVVALPLVLAGGILLGSRTWPSAAVAGQAPVVVSSVRVTELPAAEPTPSSRLLDQALQVAKDVPAKDDTTLSRKINLLVNIGRGQAAAGDKENAAKTFLAAKKLVPDLKADFFKIASLGSIAASQAAFGDVKAARVTMAPLKEFKAESLQPHLASNYNRALAEIAAVQTRAADYKAALKTADEFLEARGDKSGKTDILQRIALEQARRKDAQAAKETAAALEPGALHLGMLLQIAQIQRKHDERAATVTYRDVLAEVARVKKEEDLQGVALYQLAEALAERGESEAVLKWLESMKSSEVKALVLIGLSHGAAKHTVKPGKEE